MKDKSTTPTRDIWLEGQLQDNSSAAQRRLALLSQLCSKEAVWRHGADYRYCIIGADGASLQKAGRDYNKFFQMLYIQGIIEGGYVAGAYAKDANSFEVRVSENQLKQMQQYFLALMRKRK